MELLRGAAESVQTLRLHKEGEIDELKSRLDANIILSRQQQLDSHTLRDQIRSLRNKIKDLSLQKKTFAGLARKDPTPHKSPRTHKSLSDLSEVRTFLINSLFELFQPKAAHTDDAVVVQIQANASLVKMCEVEFKTLVKAGKADKNGAVSDFFRVAFSQVDVVSSANTITSNSSSSSSSSN
jgi:hypothetical protein